MNQEQPNEVNIHAEPVAPSVEFVTHAGNRSGRTADYAPWMQDIEDRRKRSAELEAKRQQVKPQEIKVELSAIDEVLNALDSATEDFEQTHLKPNLPLIEGKKIVADLTQRLAEEQAKLDAIEARGDSVQRLTNSVRSAESQLQSLVSRAEAEEVSRLAEKHYGWPIPHSKISPEMKREFALHASVLAFKTFYVPRSVVLPGQILSVDALQAQLQLVGEKLVALREHLETCVKTPGFRS
jgi:archaellum component FlaC